MGVDVQVQVQARFLLRDERSFADNWRRFF